MLEGLKDLFFKELPPLPESVERTNIWPYTGNPKEWIDRSDPNYTPSIYADSPMIDVTGSGVIKPVFGSFKGIVAAAREMMAAKKVVSGKPLSGMGITKDLVPSRGKLPRQKATGKNILRGGVPYMAKIKETPKNMGLRGRLQKPTTTKQASESPMGGEIHKDYQNIDLPVKWKQSLSRIRKHIEADDSFDYGIRVIDPNIDKRLDIKIPKAGKLISNSYEWIDNEFTNNQLDGVAVFTTEYQEDLPAELGDILTEALEYWTPDDDMRYILVRGEHTGHGGMPEDYAGLIRDGEAIAVFDKDGNIIDSTSDLILPKPSSPMDDLDDLIKEADELLKK